MVAAHGPAHQLEEIVLDLVVKIAAASHVEVSAG
jgi:hypothetical protein